MLTVCVCFGDDMGVLHVCDVQVVCVCGLPQCVCDMCVLLPRYGTEFEPKLECQNMTSLSCDLSTETAYDYHTSRFLARVYADAKLLGETQTFKPLEDS